MIIIDPLPHDELSFATLAAAWPDPEQRAAAEFKLASCGWQPLYGFRVWRRPMSRRGPWLCYCDGSDPGHAFDGSPS